MSGHAYSAWPLLSRQPPAAAAIRPLALQIKQLVAKTLIAAQPMLQ